MKNLKKIAAVVLTVFSLFVNSGLAVSANTVELPQTALLEKKTSSSSESQEATYEKIRSIIRKGLDSRSESINLGSYNLTPNQADILFHEVTTDKKYFNAYTFLYYEKSNGKVSEIKPQYLFPKASSDKLEQYRNAYYKYIKAFLKDVDDSWSDYQKALYVHDKLITSSDYNADKDKHHSAFTIMTEHEGCCEAYASAYAVLLRELGIKTSYVVNDSHMWNLVKLGGKWYNVDCTADDPAINNRTHTITDRCTHDDFMVSSKNLTSELHRNITALYKSDNKTYDNSSLRKSMKPAVMYGKYVIFPDVDGVIHSYNEKTGTDTKLTQVKDEWILWSTYSSGSYRYLYSKYTSAAISGSTLYYNTPEKVYAYDLKTGKSKQIAYVGHKQNKNMNIMGITIKNNKLYGYFAEDEDSKDTVMLIKDLSKKN